LLGVGEEVAEVVGTFGEAVELLKAGEDVAKTLRGDGVEGFHGLFGLLELVAGGDLVGSLVIDTSPLEETAEDVVLVLGGVLAVGDDPGDVGVLGDETLGLVGDDVLEVVAFLGADALLSGGHVELHAGEALLGSLGDVL